MSGYTAWLDESGSNQALDPGTYILGAVICDASYAPHARGMMRQLLVVKGGKLHWRDESRRRQERIANAIAGLNVEHLVVVRSGIGSDRPERQRRLCMERMLPDLVALEVSTAIFESRGPKDDRRDHQTLDQLRRKRVITSRFHIDHVGGRAEPMLWIADALCGAITRLRCGDGRYYRAIESKVTIIDC